MAGETQHKHAVKQLDAESTLRDEGTALEQHKDKTTAEFSEHFSNSSTEARVGRGLAADRAEKERDGPQQREAVIRPQQAGKIDFSSLQHRPKFSDRTWPSGKASPQSPSGKGRSREKGRRSGKCERGSPQQLYRLSINHPRSNPTIGIAYPQQKVSPPKKLEAGRGPVSGSYRFHVPSLAEREPELQQDELSYTRCFQESSQGLPPQSYTSQPPAHQQQPASMENSSAAAGTQLLLTDFQMSGSNTWQSSDKTFTGANFGVSAQKSSPLTETSKPSAFVSGPFQYGYHMLEESASDSFPCEQSAPSQDFSDSLSTVHASHSFPFASGQAQSVGQNSSQFSNEAQFVSVGSSVQCPSLSEDSASSDSSGSGSSSQQSEPGKAAMPESKDATGQTDTSGSKRNCHPKDTAANQRTLLQGSVHYARSLPQGPASQMHFPNKTFNTNATINNIHRSSVTYDKNMNNNKLVNRLPHNWDSSNKTYQPNDQNTQFNEMNDKFQFQNQPVHEQRPNSKNSRMPWQQIRPNTAVHNQNRMELSRQMNNQKLAYIVSPSDWQEDSKSLKQGTVKNSNSFQNSRQEPVKHGAGAVSTFKVEMSHTQVCESKNKTVYFGLNQPLATASQRSYSYPPLQVPPMGLMMVSPYESPLPSPVHTQASSSTCSSLSPASTSPVNFSSEDSQMSKPAPPHPFYHQTQAKSTSDHITAHQHPFHSDRGLYPADRSKDDLMGYLPNNVHTKSSMDGTKTYIDSFGVEHHQPPPPYSAHQLLATSLATANLDQLDVLLTCKQCDQNFNNLASFLGHKQYCSQHAFAQNELKEISKMDDSKKFNPEPAKSISACSNVSLSHCPSELHLSLLGLNKNGELIPDGEAKGENKDDAMKLNLFTGSGSLPVPLPELEMEDAKLDSLITEALNGMGYQSDNAEIDSSFIDAFADDELNNVKTTSSKQSLKTKECEKKNKAKAESDRSFTQGKYFYDSDEESPDSEKPHTECKVGKISLNLEQDEKINIKKEVSHKNSRGASREKTQEQDGKAKETRKLCKSEDKNSQRLVLSSKFSERCEVKGFQENAALTGCAPSAQASLSPTSKTAVKESKRKNTTGGSWSKELIHKIVQQKNKLHKLHVKGTKNLQFSLVMERLTPTVQNPAFGEYDYVSDSDDDCEPVKIASQGRLNQSSRCKYTYTKECKWRARSDRDQAAWRHESKECFEVKKSEELSLFPEKPKLKRRSSRSSTSSDLSTSVSVSSDGTSSSSSPKSTDRTDSDCEKKTDAKKKEPQEQRTYERSSPYKLCKESSKLALTFTKSVKKYNTEKAVVSEKKEAAESPKKCQSQVADTLKATDASAKTPEKRKSSPSKTKEKHVLHGKESKGGVDKNSQSEAVSVCAAQDDKQSNKPLHSDSHKKADVERSRKCRKGGEPGVAQANLSAAGAFEKQSDSALKEPITLVNDLDTHKASSLCGSLMDGVCLSPAEPADTLIQKDTLHLMPYSLEPEQGLMKSPLSFDTSAMFGELAGFDSGIYSDMPMQKEAFHAIENATDKKEEFVSSFSPFLEQRDWSMIVSPVLPDEIAQYKAEKCGEKKADYNHVPLSLPEKIIDYSANLNVSDDELEIKRIVNELETQLQTTKLESPPLLVPDSPKPLQMSKFSPLRLSDESENDSSSLDMSCPVEAINAPVDSTTHYAESALPWSSPFQFELIGGHASPRSPLPSGTAVLEPLTEKQNNGQTLITAAAEGEKVEGGEPAETKEEALEQRRYAENLMKSLEVISDSIFKEEAIICEQKEPSVTSLMSQQHQEIECQTTDVFETEDHSEKEAITRQENILSPPNINERKDEIEFILNESHSSFSERTDPAVCGIEPISSEADGPTENNSTEEGGDRALSEDCISENSDCIKPDDGPRDVTLDPCAVEEARGNSCAQENGQLLTNTCVSPEQMSMRQEDAEAVKGIIGQCDDHPLLDASVDDKEEAVTETSTEQTTAEDALSTQRDINNTEYSQCVASDNLSNLESDMSLGIMSAYKPCSPILAETNEQSIDRCSPFPSAHTTAPTDSLLILSPTQSLMDTGCCKVNPFNQPLQHDTHLQFDCIQKQEEILNVQDIKEQLPVDFMASQQNSPCREAEENHCLFMQVTQPSISLLSPSNQARATQCDNEEDTHQPSTSSNQPTEMKSPLDKDGNHNELLAAAEIEYSKISPPQLDLGEIIECKASFPSSLSVTGSAEVSEQSGSLEKTNPMYGLKLSPLNYSSLSDEPPKLHQYDYIPISPAQQSDANTHQREDLELSIKTAQIFNNKPDVTPELTPSQSAAPINETEQLTCFSLVVPSENTSLASGVKSHLEDCHNAAETTAAESEKHSSHEASIEDDTLLQKIISDGPPPPEISCENEIPLLPEPSHKQLTIETGQGSALHKQEMAKNVLGSQQGKVVCEICFLCFRTVPGLKRHKAMKHSIRAEKHAGAQSQQGAALIYEPGETAHKDDLHTCLDAISETIVISKTGETGSEEAQNETSAVTADEIGPQTPKVKKSKAKKGKTAELTAEPFSDEQLNILKTDILQAITPEFQNNALQARSKSPENHITEQAASGVEEFPHDVSVNFENTPQSVTKETEIQNTEYNEEERVTASSEEGTDKDKEELICVDGDLTGQSVEESAKINKDGAEKTAEEISEKVAVKSENSDPKEAHALPPDPPDLSPGLKAIFDDDTTFSQLFPRDEEAKRKKCPRVYTKRNKKQKSDQNPPNVTEQAVEKQPEEPAAFTEHPACQYETISIDDAIMLNMCHNRALKDDAPPQTESKQNQADNVEEIGGSHLSGLESTIDKSLSELNAETSSDPSASKPAAESSGPCPQPVPADPTEPRENLQSIDIQNISTTFQLPDIQFFDSAKDVTLAPPVEATDVDRKEEDKSSKPQERRGRKRQDGGMKVKDKQYKCKVCFSWFLTLGELNFHKLSHNPSPPPTCYMCVQRKFSSREQLRDHLWEKHAKNKSGIWTCGMCLKEISDVWMYNEHLREHATQFARRGQTQGSMLGISGIMQETAVKNFITSIMQHRPSKVSRESSKSQREAEKNGGSESATEEVKSHKVKSSGGSRPSMLTPLEVLHKVDTPKNVEMHPNCKDPSRDCHHCGKQFPKPFKLQRHLVVHNLEKIFLCHKCPVSYQEATELKEHLKRAHEEADELDSKHTTLYTCELCADVMHVIKKSFICSTCNYTFSKKEQFDRHMEKHLLGGNKIFKFRGVLRPVKASVTADSECHSPASKKRRLLSDSLPENSSDSGIASVSPLHHNSESHPAKSCAISTTDDSTQTTVSEYHDDANVKTEDEAEEYSELLIELEKCIHMSSAKEEIELSPNPDEEGNGKLISDACDVKEENESVCIRAETSPPPESRKGGGEVEETVNAKDGDLSGNITAEREAIPPLCNGKENVINSKTPEPTLLTTNTSEKQRDDEQWQKASKASSSDNKQNGAASTEPDNSSNTKEKVVQAKTADHTKAPPRVSNEDKEPPKQQKKRKDVKSSHSSQRVSPPATQENFDIDIQAKKKFRPGKCSTLQRKSDGPNDYPVLSSVHGDIVSNKMISKCKTSNNMQSKKSLLESCTPKKSDVVVSPLNGDYRAKKGSLGRPLHSPVSKVPINNSLNKSRTKMGVRTMDNHSYRTAESQNHLLSQLFGQKLTSFKIPLRKDTSESIN